MNQDSELRQIEIELESLTPRQIDADFVKAIELAKSEGAADSSRRVRRKIIPAFAPFAAAAAVAAAAAGYFVVGDAPEGEEVVMHSDGNGITPSFAAEGFRGRPVPVASYLRGVEDRGVIEVPSRGPFRTFQLKSLDEHVVPSDKGGQLKLEIAREKLIQLPLEVY